METNYTKIAEVRVEHSYYSSTSTIGLKFSLDTNTETVMKRYGIFIRSLKNGFLLYTNSPRPWTDYLAYITKSSGIDQFNINIEATDPEIYVFTKLPMNWAGTIAYSTSNAKNESDNGAIVLTPDFSNDSERSSFGKLALVFDDLADSTLNTYKIVYEAQTTQWNYYVINKSKRALNEPYIETKNTIAFNSPVSVELPNGESALLFSSGSQFIPLHNYVDESFSLADKGTNGNSTKTKIIFAGLPNPLPSRTDIVDFEGRRQMASPMYIYI